MAITAAVDDCLVSRDTAVTGVARIWCEGVGTKLRKNNLRVIQKYHIGLILTHRNCGADVPEYVGYTTAVFYWIGNYM